MPEVFLPQHFSNYFCKIITVNFAYGCCIVLLWMRCHHSSEQGGKPGRDREKLLITLTVKAICYESLN